MYYISKHAIQCDSQNLNNDLNIHADENEDLNIKCLRNICQLLFLQSLAILRNKENKYILVTETTLRQIRINANISSYFIIEDAFFQNVLLLCSR